MVSHVVLVLLRMLHFTLLALQTKWKPVHIDILGVVIILNYLALFHMMAIAAVLGTPVTLSFICCNSVYTMGISAVI